MTNMPASSMAHAKNLIKFIDKSPSPYHAVATVKEMLINKGFREINDKDEWNLKQNDLIFVTKNYSTIIALAIGGKFKPGNGISLIGAHTDSPCLKLKPHSEQSCCNYTKLGVEVYGGGLWYTWFDRDLTIAGRCVVKDKECYRHRLVNLERPVARVSSLAIHLDRTQNDAFSPNKETQLLPILCTTLADQVQPDKLTNNETPVSLGHPTCLMESIANKLEVQPDDIVDVELCFADTQPSVIGGINEEFIFAPRLDNLFNCYASVQAMLDALETVPDDVNVRAVCLYDNEEVGSQSAQGAESAFTEHVLRRALSSLSSGGGGTNTGCEYERSIANSLLVSADQAHALHPNHEDKHEKMHRPLLHRGIVLKINSNQRYASTALTNTIVREVARERQVPLQDFVVRQDMGCGSTIGPIMAAKTGLATVDVGGPQLSMHSCREMTDVSSPQHAVSLFRGFFELFPRLSEQLRQGQDE